MLYRGEGRDFGRLRVSGVVLPQPSHGVRVPSEFLRETERNAVAIHGEGRGARRVDADADHAVRVEHFVALLGLIQRPPDGDFDAGDVIGRVLTRQVGIPGVKDDSSLARGIGINVGRQLAAASDIDEESPDGIRPEVEAETVL